ncbi:lysylphosphatidylglycerol synthase domain-containing protein [Candidatus Hydrogenedentota bacterium]
MTRKTERKIILRLLQILVAIVVGYYFFRAIHASRLDAMELWRKGVDFKLLALSIALIFCSYLYGIVLWRGLLSNLGYELSFRQAWRASVLSELAKYVPGKVWTYLGKAYICKGYGVPPERTLLSSAVGTGLTWMAAAMVFLLSMPFWIDTAGNSRLMFIPALAAVPLCAVCAHPRVMGLVVNTLLRLTGRPRMDVPVKYGVILLYSGHYVTWWVIYGTAFTVMASSIRGIEEFISLDFQMCLLMTGMIAISLVAGSMVVFLPAGIGAREIALQGLLSLIMPPYAAATIAIAARIWVSALELLLLPLYLISKGHGCIIGDSARNDEEKPEE